jgi:hypothetical protein
MDETYSTNTRNEKCVPHEIFVGKSKGKEQERDLLGGKDAFERSLKKLIQRSHSVVGIPAMYSRYSGFKLRSRHRLFGQVFRDLRKSFRANIGIIPVKEPQVLPLT